jgi:hypothetical protein
MMDDPHRVLPIGGPQSSLMNHMINYPEIVRDKRVFEPFAGSGGLGFMALKIGARTIDFLDISPRAIEFQLENADLNQFSSDQFNAIEGDIGDFVPDQKYDLILANPPFVPTPNGLNGTLTSNGGVEGNHFVGILLSRLDSLLDAEGEALIYVFQIVVDEAPRIVDLIEADVLGRHVQLTPSQKRVIPFETYCSAYRQLFPEHVVAIENWENELRVRYGKDFSLCHYIAHVGRKTGAASSWEKFGEDFFVPSEDLDELATARVFENFVASMNRT